MERTDFKGPYVCMSPRGLNCHLAKGQIMSYCSFFYHNCLKIVISLYELQEALEKYRRNADKIIVWIKKTIVILDNREFPNQAHLLHVSIN